MLRPGDILENLEKFSSVARDAVDHMLTLRSLNGEMPDLEGEIVKYVAECKFFNFFSQSFQNGKVSNILSFKNHIKKQFAHMWTDILSLL